MSLIQFMIQVTPSENYTNLVNPINNKKCSFTGFIYMSKKNFKDFKSNKQFNEILDILRSDLRLSESVTADQFDDKGTIPSSLVEVDVGGRRERGSKMEPTMDTHPEYTDSEDVDNPFMPHVGDIITMDSKGHIAIAVIYKIANDVVYYKNIRYPLLVNKRSANELFMFADQEKMKSMSYGKSFTKFGVGDPDQERNDFVTNFKVGNVSEDWLPQ